MYTSIAIVTAVLLAAPAAPTAPDDDRGGDPQSAIRFVPAALPVVPAITAKQTVKPQTQVYPSAHVAWERRIADRPALQLAAPFSEPADSSQNRSRREESVLLRVSAAPARGVPEVFVQGLPVVQLPVESPADEPPAAPVDDAAPMDSAAPSAAEEVPLGTIVGDYGFVGGAGGYDEIIYDEMPIDDGAYVSGLPFRQFPFPVHSAGNMPQHLPQTFKYSEYYYLRPYNWFHIREHQEEVANYGEDPRNPYANKVFAEVYRELHLGPHQAGYLLDAHNAPNREVQP